MSAPRTVTLATIDHGDVTITCPDWCTGHDTTTPQYREDIVHEGVERILALPHRGGNHQLLTLALEQRPFADRWPGTAPFVSVGFSGDHHPMRRPGLHAAADALEMHAAMLRHFAVELGGLLDGGQ
jgi:hypothetical protein